MQTLPWSVDRALSDGAALELITSQFPQLSLQQVTARYEGWDHQAVEIDGQWFFRFPKRAECEPPLQRELALLPHLAPLLPVAIPRYQFIGKPTSQFPYIFAGYARLPGIPAIESPIQSTSAVTLAAGLGQTLSILHSVPAETARTWGVPPGADTPATMVRSAFVELEAIKP
ncbi:MAG: hypothetical protein M3347_11025, partial [Armatimonadota bacterium]|nr:hypothetical protein [Armatimonadota bacterium]